MHSSVKASPSGRSLLVALLLSTGASSSNAQEFDELGDLAGGSFYSFPFAISADGSVVVGESNSANGTEAFRWTAGGGMVGLGDLAGGLFSSRANGVSADGSVVVGLGQSANGSEAFSWTSGGGMVGLGDLAGGGFSSIALDVNADGSVVVGRGESANGEEAFRWTAGGGMVGLGDLAGGAFSSTGQAVSADGSVVVGHGTSASGDEAFRWTAGGGMVGLGYLAGGAFFSRASAVSADGSVVVGQGNSANGAEAFRWTAGGGMVGLGDLAGGSFQSLANAVNADGSVVVGRGQSAGGAEAFRWTSTHGMESVRDILVAAGVDVTGWSLATATDVSASGNVIVGRGFNPSAQSWIARIDADGVTGLTTPGSVVQSMNELSDARVGAMAQHHGFALPLLGGDKPLANGSEAGAFGMGGSAAGGGAARFANAYGLAILAGVSYGEEAYQGVEVEDSLMGAVALRYLAPGAGWLRPFAEAGGWLAPDTSFTFDRTYANGAGTARGVGTTEGDMSYLFARAGVAVSLGKSDQFSLSAEIGRQRVEVDGYTEALSAGNPFNAQVAAGSERMDIAKARVAWSFLLGPRYDATLWASGAYGFNRDSDLVATVASVGTLAAAPDDDGNAWIEYGARVGYAVTDSVTFDVFTNGVSGPGAIDTRIHGGAGLRFRF